MKPYLTDKKVGSPKFTPEKGRGLGISKLAKLIARNANRAGKKAKRQYEKLAIKNQLQDIYNEPVYQVEDILKASVEEDDLTAWEEKGLIPPQNEVQQEDENNISGHRRSVEFEQFSENEEELSSETESGGKGSRSINDQSDSSSEGESNSEGDERDIDPIL